MKATVKTTAIVLTVLVILTVGSPSRVYGQAGELPAVLAQMPNGAMAVLATKPISSVSAGVDAFAQQLGIVPPGESLNLPAMLSGQLSQGFGVPVNLDSSKGFGIAVMNLMMFEKTLVAYLPMVDAKALIDSLPAKQSISPGVWKVGEEAKPSDIYVSTSGQYLLVAQQGNVLAELAQGPKGVKLNKVQTQLFADSDVAATVSLSAVMPMVKGFASMGMASNPDIAKHPSISKILTMAVDRVCELKGVGVGVNVSKAGLGLALNFQAAPGTKLANFLSNQPTTDTSSLSALPDGNYLYAATMKSDAKKCAAPINAVMDALAADITLGEIISPTDIAQLKTIFADYCRILSNTTSAEYTFENVSDAGMFNTGEIAIIEAGADEMTKLLAKVCPPINKILKNIKVPVSVVYKSKAGTSAGLSYDELVIDLSKAAPTPEVAKQLSVFYGDDLTLRVLLCKIGSKKVVSAMSPGILAKTIELAKSTSAGIAKRPDITSVKGKLPSKANVYSFISVGNIMKFMANILQAQMTALQAQMQPGQQMTQMMGMMPMIAGMLSQVTGSLAVSSAFEDECLKSRIFISSELAGSVYKTGQMAIGAIMGGMGGPPPGQPSDM